MSDFYRKPRPGDVYEATKPRGMNMTLLALRTDDNGWQYWETVTNKGLLYRGQALLESLIETGAIVLVASLDEEKVPE